MIFARCSGATGFQQCKWYIVTSGQLYTGTYSNSHPSLTITITNPDDNGAKYSEIGKTVTIETSIAEDMISIKVQDEGVGIKEEDYDKLFKKFSRLENYLTSKTQGNGLGLYITKELVEKMNGKISFSSSANGTVFEVKFPLYNQEDALKCFQMS